MKIRRESPSLLLWVITPLVSLLGGLTQYPNQIYTGYEILEVCVAAILIKQFVLIVRLQLKWIALLLLYSVTFIVVSMYGVDFQTSVEYGVFYQPLLITLEFALAFTIGYAFHETRTFKYMRWFAFLLIAYTLVEIRLFPDKSRFITNLYLPMAIPLFVFSRQVIMAVVTLLVLFLSLKKTVVGCGVLSLCAAFLLRRYVAAATGDDRATRTASLNGILISLGALTVAFIGVTAIVMMFGTYISATLARFSEAEDVSRASIAAYSLILLKENFPWGIGWFGFLYMSIGVISYDVTDARGAVHAGAPLHNTFMTWALEGGLPILAIVTVLFLNLARVIRFLLGFEAASLLGATVLIWLLSGVLYGSFQQWHESGTLWELFGFAFGGYERYRRVYAANNRPHDSHS